MISTQLSWKPWSNKSNRRNSFLGPNISKRIVYGVHNIARSTWSTEGILHQIPWTGSFIFKWIEKNKHWSFNFVCLKRRHVYVMWAIRNTVVHIVGLCAAYQGSIPTQSALVKHPVIYIYIFFFFWYVHVKCIPMVLNEAKALASAVWRIALLTQITSLFAYWAHQALAANHRLPHLSTVFDSKLDFPFRFHNTTKTTIHADINRCA